MKNDTEISTEIKEISPLLAGLRDKNVFDVPKGYFDSLTANIQEKLLTEKLRSYSPVTQEVPEDYFKTLSNHILEKIKLQEQSEENSGELSDLLENQISRRNIFTLPVGYFEDLSTKIFARISQIEEQSVTEQFEIQINEIKKHNVFTVPEGYFESVGPKIMAQITPQTKGRVIPFYKSYIFRYSAAAVIAALVFLTIFFTIGDFRQPHGFAVVNKHTVPDRAALKFDSEKAFEKGLASLSDDQIIAYLEAHGNILDNDQLEKNTNLSGMPDPMEYLENDNTLENYLRTISNSGNPVQKIN